MMLDQANRTFICSVVFVDLVGYSKKSVAEQIAVKDRFTALLSESLKDIAVNDRIILDTGDGAAMSFLGDPEDALFVAMNLRDSMKVDVSELEGAAGRDEEEEGLICIGINLGPVKLVKDINGHPNIIGDGINVAQRIMSFAKPGQVVVSRSYYDVVSCLSEEYAKLFKYEGSRTDKHVREHDIYLVGESERAFKEAKSGMENRAAQTNPRGRAHSGAARISTGSGGFSRWTTDEAVTGFFQDRKKVMITGGALGAVVLLLAILLIAKKPVQPTVAAPAASLQSAPATAPATVAQSEIAKPEPPKVASQGAAAPATGPAASIPPAVESAKAPDSAAPAHSPASGAPAKHSSPTSALTGTAKTDASKADASKGEPNKPDLPPGTVNLAVVPWGEIYVNGKSRGVSPPIKNLKLPPGKYKIEIRNTTFAPHSEAIEVKSREEITIRHKFQ